MVTSREEARLKHSHLFRNSIFSSEPEFLHIQFIKCCDSHNYLFRKEGDGRIMLPCPNSNDLKKTVIYWAINYRNHFPPHICQSNCKSSFKYHLKMHYLTADCSPALVMTSECICSNTVHVMHHENNDHFLVTVHMC